MKLLSAIASPTASLELDLCVCVLINALLGVTLVSLKFSPRLRAFPARHNSAVMMTTMPMMMGGGGWRKTSGQASAERL